MRPKSVHMTIAEEEWTAQYSHTVPAAAHEEEAPEPPTYSARSSYLSHGSAIPIKFDSWVTISARATIYETNESTATATAKADQWQ